MTDNDQTAPALLREGERAAADGRWMDALEAFQRAAGIVPGSCAAQQGLSVSHHHLGHPQEAWDCAVQAWRLDPDHPDSIPNLEDLAREQGRSEELARVLGSRASDDPLCDEGEAAVEEGRFPDAVLSFLQALDSDPSRSRAWGGIGVACFRRGWPVAARAFFEMAVRLDPADEDAILNWSDTSDRILSSGEIEAALREMGVSDALCRKAVSSRGP